MGCKIQSTYLSTGWTGCGHFTQLVWKGSKKLGLGVAQDRSGKRYVVAQYDPVGNIEGKYEVNAQLPGTMVAKYYGHKNVITKSKQKNRAYFWTIPFLVKYTGSKEK